MRGGLESSSRKNSGLRGRSSGSSSDAIPVCRQPCSDFLIISLGINTFLFQRVFMKSTGGNEYGGLEEDKELEPWKGVGGSDYLSRPSQA